MNRMLTATDRTGVKKDADTPRLAKIGNSMRRHRTAILVLQWIVVVFYFFLLIIPGFMALPPEDAHLYDNLRLFAQFLFWGIWWPFVMLSTMLLGRVWCGVFCPEGALTEFAGRHGLGRSIPRWMRWSGWPLTAFVCTTIYGQLISVYDYPKAALLILGGSSVAAVVVGFVYGKGKRVWCRYLCPANGVFSLLAKIAPVHFRVNEEAWKRDTTRQPMVDCAPLIDIRHMKSASACHACGRCSDFKGAVTLAARSPASEILNTNNHDVKTEEALMLVFGVIGIATAAFQWSASAYLVEMKTAMATWLIDHNSFFLLQDDAPWWLLTHYPAAHDVFTWLDGICILIFVVGGGSALGLAVLTAVWLAARLANHPTLSWQRLALSLVPIAGAGIFLGLSMLTLSHLKAERIPLEWVPATRAILLATGSGFSAYLGWKLTVVRFSVRPLLAFSVSLLPIVLIDAIWVAIFFV
ncbi:MAG: 4Fe-4S binding protein [Polaromonas sp.]|nr:4Fe-4S binding protein [Polaromonas sp.]